MSGSQISDHIPDISLITYYSENGSSILSRISPWTKLAALIAIIAALAVVQSIALLAAIYVAVLAAYWLCSLPVRKLLDWYFIPVAFVLSIVVLLMWGEPGRALLTLPTPWISLTLTDNGLLLAVRLLLKALISMTSSFLLLMTTRYAQLSAMIGRIFPSPMDQIFLMSYRFLFVTLSMVDSMMRAFRSRGGGVIKSISRQSRTFSEIFALVFIRSYDRAERVSKAMESRGYSGTYGTATEIEPMRPGEVAALLMISAAVVYLVMSSGSLV